MKDIGQHSPAPVIRIVVVDDSKFLRTILVVLLEDHPGLEVVGTAENGREALQVVQEMQPDVVITDLEMPEMDGVEFIREQMTRKPTPILVLSSLSRDSQLATDALLSGAFEMIRKPQKASEALAHRSQLEESVLRAAGF